jgi:UPF0716 family protein affecting phage T7 exclusion
MLIGALSSPLALPLFIPAKRLIMMSKSMWVMIVQNIPGIKLIDGKEKRALM